MSMEKQIYVTNGKWIWWELDRKHDLIRNINIFPKPYFLIINTEKKTHQNTQNIRIHQLAITHMIYIMTQWIHIANVKWFWWELDRKYELIRNLNIFPRPHKNTEKHPKCIKDKIYQLEIMHLLMGVIQWLYVANLKWIWWELDSKRDLIRNLNTKRKTPPTTPPLTSWSYQYPIFQAS